MQTKPTEYVRITLIVSPRGCPKCAKCEKMIAALQRRYPGRIDFRKFPADAPEADRYGVVMPPMVIVDDFIACAGNVPRESALERLVSEQLGEASTASPQTSQR